MSLCYILVNCKSYIIIIILLYFVALSGFHEVSSLRQQGVEEAIHTAIINGLSDKKKKKRFNLFKRK